MKQRNFIKTIKEKGDTKMNNEKIYSLRLTESEIMDIKTKFMMQLWICGLEKLQAKNLKIE